MTGPVEISEEVSDALLAGTPVVALESTIYSGFGLPAPHNHQCLERTLAAVAAGGAVAAITAVIDGEARVGLEPGEHERILGADQKLAMRDLGPAVARGVRAGATTVSASLQLATLAGIDVFATGGIGGVHRDVAQSSDVSSDLAALERFPVTTVTAGAKAFLDLARTLEYLETLGVPVLGYGTDEFPAFYSRSSGLSLSERVDDAAAAAAAVTASRGLGYGGGVVVAVPIPTAAEIPAADVDAAISSALAEVGEQGVTGAAVTPFVLERVSRAMGGRTLSANLALAERNAEVAAALAAALVAS